MRSSGEDPIRDENAREMVYTPIEVLKPSRSRWFRPTTPKAPFDLTHAGLGIPIPMSDSDRETKNRLKDVANAIADTMPSLGMRTPGDPRYLSFYSRLYDKVEINWHNEWRRILTRLPLLNISRTHYEALVELTFNEEGEITETKLLQSSGITDLDTAAIQAIVKARTAPHPPLALFRGPEKQNHLVYSFNYEFSY